MSVAAIGICTHPLAVQVWNGLRVRIGANYGQVQIIWDKVMKGYDYFGPVVNTAARIEQLAHGGQILMTSQLHDAVAGKIPFDSRHLGAERLRGVSVPIVLVLAVPRVLARRTFPPLNVGRAEQDWHETVSSGPTSYYEPALVPTLPADLAPKSERAEAILERGVAAHPLVDSGTLEHHKAMGLVHTIYAVLRAQLTLERNKNRRPMLAEWCKQWHVTWDRMETGRFLI